MKKRLAAYVTAVAGVAFLFLGVVYLSTAQAQGATNPPGSYSLTCKNIAFSGSSGQTPTTLSATCQTANGSWQQTTLAYDIANCNGNLKWAPGGC